MTSKFICKACGQCCSNIRGLIGEKDKQFLKEFAYGRLPLVALKPVEELTFPLWDWEAKRFISQAEEKGIDHKIIPSRVMYDLNTNSTIVVTYAIDSASCTFLKDNKCQVYENRAFICRFFPFQHGPFLKMDEKITKESMFGSCPSITQILQEVDESSQGILVKQLYDSFGDNFLAVVQADLATEWINSKIIYILQNRQIRPALNYPYDKLLKRIETSQMVDLSDFMIKNAVVSKGDMEKAISRFENFEDA
ncbi:MAG: YkgJ family cysteine cluster protein, partial [Nanoarchaeota archaeon]